MVFEEVRKRDHGQVGIGTLVVFIAMVLVAAIGAGVLINTADILENRGDSTGQESSQQVSHRVSVVSALGHVTDETNDGLTKSGGDAEENLSVDVVKLTVALSPGSGDVNLSKATIDWVGPNRAVTLVHGAAADHEPTVGGSDPGTFDLNPSPGGGGGGGGGGSGTASGTAGTFNTYAINSNEHQALVNHDQRINVFLNVSQIASGTDGGTADRDRQPLGEGTMVEVKITTASGATTLYEITVPESVSGEDYVSV